MEICASIELIAHPTDCSRWIQALLAANVCREVKSAICAGCVFHDQTYQRH